MRPENVPLKPAPWNLSGQAYVISVRLPAVQLERDSFIPAGLKRATRSRIAQVMFVDYAGSDVGPYHELLFIPGKLGFGTERFLSITRIFVSTWDSVINGEINWGIPKDRCDFQVSYGADGVDHVALTAADGMRFAELELQAHGPRLPAPGHWVPKRLRTLAQLRDGKRYSYTPEARGHFRFARVRNWRFDARYFPDLARGEVVSAVKLTDFRMIFPLAHIQTMTI